MEKSRGVLKLAIFAVFIAVAGVATMVLWNATIPTVIGWERLSYLQAVGIFLLCRLLFGGVAGLKERARMSMMNDQRDEVNEQLKGMNREQRIEYIRNYRGRRGNREHCRNQDQNEQ